MLFYLFSSEELGEIFRRLGYDFDPEMIPANIAYYMRRTSHGSTLSRIVHSWVLARSERERAWELFEDALESDIADIQGGTTPEGIHLGAMAGTVDLIQRCHAGIEMRGELLRLNPRLPDELESVDFRLRYRGHWLRLKITRDLLVVSFEKGWSESIKIGFRDRVHSMRQGETRRFELRGET